MVADILFFLHLFVGISVKILNIITYFSPLFALSLLYRWNFASFVMAGFEVD